MAAFSQRIRAHLAETEFKLTKTSKFEKSSLIATNEATNQGKKYKSYSKTYIF